MDFDKSTNVDGINKFQLHSRTNSSASVFNKSLYFINNKKGLATLEVVITTFFMLAIVFLFGVMAIQNAVKQDEITIIQRDVLLVKNTFSLFNRSLDATWSFSSVQALFKASENGFELSSLSEENPDAYWYRFHPDKPLDLKLSDDIPQGISGVPNRCNQPGGNPGICMPKQANIQNFMNITMRYIWFDL